MGILDAPGAPILKPLLTNPKGLHRWREALGDAYYGQPIITCYGDSITFGVGDNNTNSETDATQDQSWVGTLRSRFAERYGDAGEGYIIPFDSRFTSGGSPSGAGTIGPHATGRKLNSATDTLTWVLPRCTAIDIVVWWNAAGGTQAPSYNIDGGSDVVAASGSGDDRHYKVAITGLADTTHTIVIKGHASGETYIAGVIAKRGTTGVRVHRLGKTGYTTSEALGIDQGFDATQRDRLLRGTFQQSFLAPSTHLAIISFGVNDQAEQVSGGTTPTVYAANLTEMITLVTGASVGGCVLLVGEPFSPGAPALTFTEANYHAAAKALATAGSNVAFLDVTDVWGTAAQSQTAGLQYPSSVHPSRKGHGDIGNMIFNALTGPGMVQP